MLIEATGKLYIDKIKNDIGTNCGEVSRSKWKAEAVLYQYAKNPKWCIKQSHTKKLLKLAHELPASTEGIPSNDMKGSMGCNLYFENQFSLSTYSGIIILFNGSILEIKKDESFIIENELLRSAPDEIYKEICEFL